jgi:uncharacterized membrane protein YfcA
VDPARDGLLLGASTLAGAVNAVAGGGTLLSFPVAIAWGLPSPIANATNAVAMAPGSLASAWAYRRELAGGGRRLTALLIAPTIAGAVLGAYIMRHTPERVFDALVPALVLGATLVILLQGLIARRSAVARHDAHSRARTAATIGCQLVVGVYGGYFGAAMGIVMLAVLSLMATGDIHNRNAVKNLLSAAANGVAAVTFAIYGMVDARAALFMTPGAIIGGFVGAHLARRAPARVVRALVVAIGFGLSALLAYRAYARHAT